MLSTRHKVVLGFAILLPTVLVIAFVIFLSTRIGVSGLDKAFQSFRKKPPQAVESRSRANDLLFVMKLSEQNFERGEKISARLSVKNVGSHTKKLSYVSGQKFDLSVVKKTGSKVWRWSDGMMFTLAVEPVTLKPGKTVKETISWNQKDSNDQQIPLGEYIIIGESKAAQLEKLVKIRVKIEKSDSQ